MDMLLNRYTDGYVAGDGMCGGGCCSVPTKPLDRHVSDVQHCLERRKK